MKVLMLVGDKPGFVTGCGLYRMHFPAKQLKVHGADVTVAVSLPATTRVRDDGLPEVVDVPQLGYDVVVFQRPASLLLATAIPHVKRQAAVIVELDDDLERTSTGNMAYDYVHPRRPDENWHHLRDACRAADYVTVSTPALLRYAPDGRGEVLRNCVPLSMTYSERAFVWQDGKPRVGWSGVVGTHPNDLQTTRGGVAAALAKTGTPFHVVGESAGIGSALQLRPGTACTESGWQPIADYPDALTAIDVGVVPLEDTAFNRAKSALKGMEFAALGIPFVASPTPEYRWLAEEHGVGLLAHRPREWTRLVAELVNDEGMRRELGQAWRVKVRGNLTCETNGWRWMRAYEEAAAIGSARLTTAGR